MEWILFFVGIALTFGGFAPGLRQLTASIPGVGKFTGPAGVVLIILSFIF